MIRHIVMWKFAEFAENCSKEDNILKTEKSLYALLPFIKEIKSMEIGKNINQCEMAFDMVLTCDFDSFDDLCKYQEHTEHKKVSEFVKKVRTDRAIVDYEI